ncbi:pilus assembly protein TadG-related protein [Nocardia transvalensis]|uniref:pilus assembly protein TadG-related protein n=1 Tax=Nocardia transvalensis TaxID=37333 RepID=UPI0018956960|nr:pilus assembly protein TadG-related protein [Nocardia transvalensis]MBF6333620.1 pilus assembly protein [Nocardia transvalensis]
MTTGEPTPRALIAATIDRAGDRLRLAATWMRGTAARGAYVLWWSLSMFALAVMLGLAVDGGGKVHARQHANLVAEQAARTAGQQVVRPLGMRGIAAVSDPLLAQGAAQAYLALHPDVHGVVIPTGPTTLTVITSVVYQPKILGFIGVGPQPVEGRAVITLNRTNNGLTGFP